MIADAQILIRPSRDKRAYRLKCRFQIEPYPRMDRLDREKVNIAERFVRDMHTQGWENLPNYGFEVRGPFPKVTPVTIRVPRAFVAREMLPRIARGARFPDDGRDYASTVPELNATEWWEYEIRGVFIRDEILVERPELHEERRN